MLKLCSHFAPTCVVSFAGLASLLEEVAGPQVLSPCGKVPPPASLFASPTKPSTAAQRHGSPSKLPAASSQWRSPSKAGPAAGSHHGGSPSKLPGASPLFASPADSSRTTPASGSRIPRLTPFDRPFERLNAELDAIRYEKDRLQVENNGLQVRAVPVPVAVDIEHA